MKLIKLSLVGISILSLSTNVFSADSLTDAFKEGKVNGQLKSYFIDTAYNGTQSDKDAFAIGGILKYTTGDFKGFSAGFGFQTSHTLGFDHETGDSKVDDTTVSIQETLLSEAYLAYKYKKTTVRIGRTFIKTPLVANSGSRLLKDYFTGALVTNKSLKNTTIVAGYITDWTSRNNASTHFDSPVYTLYANTKIANFTITAQAVFNDSVSSGTEDGTKDYYLETTYKLPVSTPVTLGAQYIGYENDADSSKDSSVYGIKAEIKLSGFALGAYYNSTDDDGTVRGGVGTAKDPSYNDLYTISGTKAGTKSYQGKVSYNFAEVGIKGLKAMTRYAVYNDYGNDGIDANSLDMDISYAFSGSLKGLFGQVIYAMTEIDNADDFNHLRLKLNYKF